MGDMVNITRNDFGIILMGPAVLAGILGFLAYLAWDFQAKTLVIAVLFVIVGIFLVSLAAYAFRRLLLPNDKKDIVE